MARVSVRPNCFAVIGHAPRQYDFNDIDGNDSGVLRRAPALPRSTVTSILPPDMMRSPAPQRFTWHSRARRVGSVSGEPLRNLDCASSLPGADDYPSPALVDEVAQRRGQVLSRLRPGGRGCGFIELAVLPTLENGIPGGSLRSLSHCRRLQCAVELPGVQWVCIFAMIFSCGIFMHLE